MATTTIDWVPGNDVSHWQGAKVALSPGSRFLIAKVSQGGGAGDSAMAAHRARAERDGLDPGGYHFVDCRSTPGDNVDNFIGRSAGYHWTAGLWLDYENQSGSWGTPKVNARALLDMLEQLDAASDEAVGVYTGKSWWDSKVARDPAFARYRIWVARYPNRNATTPPASFGSTRPPADWPEIDVWQFSDAGGRLDCNASPADRYAALTASRTTPILFTPDELKEFTMADAAQILKNQQTIIAQNKAIALGETYLAQQNDNVLRLLGEVKGYAKASALDGKTPAEQAAIKTEATRWDPISGPATKKA